MYLLMFSQGITFLAAGISPFPIQVLQQLAVLIQRVLASPLLQYFKLLSNLVTNPVMHAPLVPLIHTDSRLVFPPSILCASGEIDIFLHWLIVVDVLVVAVIAIIIVNS